MPEKVDPKQVVSFGELPMS